MTRKNRPAAVPSPPPAPPSPPPPVDEKLPILGIPIIGEIGWDDVQAILNVVRSLDHPVPLAVDICSPGGMFDAGMAIYDIFRTWPLQVTTVVYGCADSAAAIIMQAGDLRVMSPKATVQIHNVIHQFNGTLDETAFEKAKRLYESSQSRLIAILAERTGQEEDQISEWCDEDKIFTAEEAIKHGIADKIIPFREQPPKE